MRRWLAMAAVLAPMVTSAAIPTPTREQHIQRLQLLSGLAWNGRWAPDVPEAGLLYQLSISTTKVRHGEGDTIVPPSVFLHAGAMAGVNLFRDPHAVGTGSLGVMVRRRWQTVTSAGLVAVGTIAQRRLGPAVRVEFADLIGLQAGATLHAGHPYVFVSLDVMFGLLRDIGF